MKRASCARGRSCCETRLGPTGVGRRRASLRTKIQQPRSREDPSTKIQMTDRFERILGCWCLEPGAWMLRRPSIAKYRFVSKCETGAGGALVPQSRYLRHSGRGSVSPLDTEEKNKDS